MIDCLTSYNTVVCCLLHVAALQSIVTVGKRKFPNSLNKWIFPTYQCCPWPGWIAQKQPQSSLRSWKSKTRLASLAARLTQLFKKRRPLTWVHQTYSNCTEQSTLHEIKPNIRHIVLLLRAYSCITTTALLASIHSVVCGLLNLGKRKSVTVSPLPYQSSTKCSKLDLQVSEGERPRFWFWMRTSCWIVKHVQSKPCSHGL